MNKHDFRALSKKLSLVLRHRPDTIGITLDPNGWVEVDTLILAMNAAGKPYTRALLEEIVATNDKNRFEFSGDHERIRARQGHSVQVDLAYEPSAPPDVLYHGTARQFVDSILESGLNRRNRHDVHMSTDLDMMRRVGSRRGQPAIMAIDAKAMHEAGHQFYVTGNNVWLTESVPAAYIREHEASG